MIFAREHRGDLGVVHHRNAIERMFGRLKDLRRIATDYDARLQVVTR